MVRRHGLTPESTPTSTVAIARWNDAAVDVYLLGDSTAAALFADGHEESKTDDSLAAVAPGLRAAYRQRLQSGSGFDADHERLLSDLQRVQRVQRNHPGGYWVAGADPSAAHNGKEWHLDREDVAALVLATDGAAAGVTEYQTFATWHALAAAIDRDGPDSALQQIERDEATDPDGQRWPRSKPADDKTLAYVRFLLRQQMCEPSSPPDV
jgi:hypothetical protein